MAVSSNLPQNHGGGDSSFSVQQAINNGKKAIYNM